MSETAAQGQSEAQERPSDRESGPGGGRIEALLASELGAELAGVMASMRAVQERRERERHPDEGLRERKKRLTRQDISDVATALFLVRGFDQVTVAEVAETVGVSEKTVYNYFPTKESLVFDRTDEATAELAATIRAREPGESPTRAMLRALEEESDEFAQLPDGAAMLLPLFAELVSSTPQLRAAWLDLQDRLVGVATAELARHAELDPREPEPTIAASAIVGLMRLSFNSRIRHVEGGLRGAELSEAVASDLERAARLLDTGLWSFNLLAQGARTRAQWREAERASEEARQQVMSALRQARSTWQQITSQVREHAEAHQQAAARGEGAREAAAQMRAAKAELKVAEAARQAHERAAQAAGRAEARRAAQEVRRAAAETRRAASETKRAAAETSRAAFEAAASKKAAEHSRRAAREAPREPGLDTTRSARAESNRAAYIDFRRRLAERHEAIRARTPEGPSETGGGI